MSFVSLSAHTKETNVKIYPIGSTYYAADKNGKVILSNTDIGALLNSLNPSLVDGDVVSFQTAIYAGSTPYVNDSRRRITYRGNGSQITQSKWQIGKTASASYSDASHCTLDNFFFNGADTGVILDNTYNPQIMNTIFFGCDEGLSVMSTGAWTEFLTLRRVSFDVCKKGIVFKTPTGTGSGSYVNILFDVVNFNAANGWDPGAPYTFIETQTGAQVNESKWLNLRLWFSSSAQQGIGIEHNGDASRCQLFRPYFENFGTAQNTIGIRYNAGAAGGFYFVGRPIFAGAGTWAGKLINNSDKWVASDVTSWRKTTQIASVGTSSAFGSSTTAINAQTIAGQVRGMPNLHIFTTGIRANEKITVEITINTSSTITPVITKVIQGSGWWPISLADYVTALPNDFYYMIDTITARAHTNQADTTGIAVYVGAVEGGTWVPNPSAEPFRTRISSDAQFIGYRPLNSVASGQGMYFNMDNSANNEANYARLYALIDTNTAGSHSGKFSFQLANAGSIAERFGIEKNGALITKSYTDYTKIAAPADPGAEVGRLYFKEKDGSNNGLFVKLKIGGSIVEKEVAFVA